ncbi:hypothetical protein A6A30_26385 [Klebsiella michiganensis]|nr:hypothetical protein A6A30_26385 [Klebsiella michiganensis]
MRERIRRTDLHALRFQVLRKWPYEQVFIFTGVRNKNIILRRFIFIINGIVDTSFTGEHTTMKGPYLRVHFFFKFFV